MPKTNYSTTYKLNQFIREFGKDIFSTDGTALFCKICEKAVNWEKNILLLNI